jgi:hypothetical protein
MKINKNTLETKLDTLTTFFEGKRDTSAVFIAGILSDEAKNSLINYLGEKEFLLHKQFLNILAHMVVYQFKDDPNLEGDYSSLLYMSAFVF